MTANPRASIHTLGCRLNQAESVLLLDQLEAAGYTVVGFGEPADLGIINTCTVTQEAEAKCRKAIRRFLRANPEGFLAVVGCYSQTGAKAIAAISGVDLIVGNEDKLNVLDHARMGKNPAPVILRDRIDPEDFSISFAGERPWPKRANLKVQDGCDFMCSFCIIPFARGRARSRDWDNTLAEARSLAARGVRELVLTGVNIGTYAHSGHGIEDLVDALAAVDGLRRIRISSIEPTTVPTGILHRMADPTHPLMPLLHLPLQAGSDAVLGAMRRKYTAAEYVAFAREALRTVPDLCLGTDIMVGFPGETEDAFAETCRLFSETDFAYAHIFPYSERPGTLVVKRGTAMVPVPERRRRREVLRRLDARRRRRFMDRYIGESCEVLMEDPREGRWPCLTANYIRVVVDGPPGEDIRNRFARVRLDRVAGDYAEGTLVSLEGSESLSARAV
ncbi:MAG: tRNA (N(6)-L-threonylcarbamoyladenosine(37)-C(2))-methylthiotransferase MtaB [Opitutales bacterium]|nr:tRNA (N(6)-L-threonylcarbamoyladenosine(37)-C(2))-methylthiotransferase MtaB [Opitutales bacterium]